MIFFYNFSRHHTKTFTLSAILNHILTQTIVKRCNLKERNVQNQLLFFVIDDMITQEKIQKLLFLFFCGGGGGNKLQKFYFLFCYYINNDGPQVH